MKYILILIGMASLIACAPAAPIPVDIATAVARKPVEELPVYASIEQQRCPKAHFSSYQKKNECTLAVRRELAARDLIRSKNQ